ncbi:hypothetical protein EDB84DRAFT_1566133 [Lactarius hengduanensis]|nr:hypothetical protein EDB84DRAFT_1566133 [Lactarius hengduanensis]
MPPLLQQLYYLREQVQYGFTESHRLSRLFHSPAFSLETFPFSDKELDEAGLRGEGESLSHFARLSTLTISLVGVSEFVIQTMVTMMKHPELLSGESLSFFPHLYHTYHFAFRSVPVYAPVFGILYCAPDTLQCINYSGNHKSLSSPTSPALSEVSYLSALSIASDATAVTPYDISEWEKTTYYHGISLDHPQRRSKR